MHRGNFITVAASITIVFVTPSLVAASLRPLPLDEQAVISAYFREEMATWPLADWVVCDITCGATSPDKNPPAEELQRLREDTILTDPAHAEAFENMLRNSQTPATVSPMTNFGKVLRPISEKAAHELFPCKPSEFFYGGYGNKTGVMYASRPGFDAKRTVAMVYIAERHSWATHFGDVEVFKRAGNQWVRELYHQSLGGPGAGINFVCELRYYLSGLPSPENPPLQVVENQGTNVICSIGDPAKLYRTTNGLSPFEINGFVLQVVAPPQYAGQLLTAHFDGPLASGNPLKAFSFGKRYQINLGEKALGELGFHLCR